MTLLSSRNATSADFERTIASLAAGEIDVAPWITHRTSADELVEKFPQWVEDRTGYIKGLVQF